MKLRYSFGVILIIIMLTISACQDNLTLEETEVVIERQENTPPEPTGYPVEELQPGDEGYPIEDYLPPPLDAGYPVNEEDIHWLFRTWSLSYYSENGISSDPPLKTIRFDADGSYEIITASETTTGNWTYSLLSPEAILILDPDSQPPHFFDIIELKPEFLNLRSTQGDSDINEQYLPAE